MEGSIVFYTYGSTLELYGQQFTAGMLTADLLNLSPDEYQPMSKRMEQVTILAEADRRPRRRPVRKRCFAACPRQWFAVGS